MTSPSTYAKLPAGTVVMFGDAGAEVAAMKPLANCEAVGETGFTAGFSEVTTLLSDQKQYISDIPDGPDKEFVFIDNPGDANFEEFLTAAAALSQKQVYIEFPNGRTASMLVALAGHKMQALDKSQAMRQVVAAKQNGITWGTKA